MTGDGSELWDDGDAFNLGQSRVNGDDVVAVFLKQDLGAVGVAIRLVAGAEDDDAFRCVGGHGWVAEGRVIARTKIRTEGGLSFLLRRRFYNSVTTFYNCLTTRTQKRASLQGGTIRSMAREAAETPLNFRWVHLGC